MIRGSRKVADRAVGRGSIFRGSCLVNGGGKNMEVLAILPDGGNRWVSSTGTSPGDRLEFEEGGPA
jgi:hypothetical protein